MITESDREIGQQANARLGRLLGFEKKNIPVFILTGVVIGVCAVAGAGSLVTILAAAGFQVIWGVVSGVREVRRR